MTLTDQELDKKLENVTDTADADLLMEIWHARKIMRRACKVLNKTIDFSYEVTSLRDQVDNYMQAYMGLQCDKSRPRLDRTLEDVPTEMSPRKVRLDSH